VSADYFFCFNKGDYVRRNKDNAGGTGCIICRVLAGDPGVADLTVYGDDLAGVSLNLYPYNPGHLLIFPLRHIEDIRHLTKKENDRLTALTGYFLDILDQTLQPGAYNIGYNMGRDAGASLTHLHQHIIPRYPHEIGLADIIAGKRVLIEDPRLTREKLKAAVYARPFSISMT
jgi:ATP adenylyltransferase